MYIYMQVHLHTYVYIIYNIHEGSTVKPTKCCLQKVGEEGELGNIIKEVNLFKVCCTHIQYYHRPSCTINICSFKKKKRTLCWA
jgi:hypothetical protein